MNYLPICWGVRTKPHLYRDEEGSTVEPTCLRRVKYRTSAYTYHICHSNTIENSKLHVPCFSIPDAFRQ